MVGRWILHGSHLRACRYYPGCWVRWTWTSHLHWCRRCWSFQLVDDFEGVLCELRESCSGVEMVADLCSSLDRPSTMPWISTPYVSRSPSTELSNAKAHSSSSPLSLLSPLARSPTHSATESPVSSVSSSPESSPAPTPRLPTAILPSPEDGWMVTGSKSVISSLGFALFGDGEFLLFLELQKRADRDAPTRTFVVCWILMTLINLIPGCKFRTDEEGEIVGVDDAECGEWAVRSVPLLLSLSLADPPSLLLIVRLRPHPPRRGIHLRYGPSSLPPRQQGSGARSTNGSRAWRPHCRLGTRDG